MEKLVFSAFLTIALAWFHPLYASEQLEFSGPFTNTTFNLSGNVIIDMVINDDNSLTGYVNFTNYPDVTTLCGAGNFTGTKSGNNLEFSFISDDPDSGCGFDKGLKFDLIASLSEAGGRYDYERRLFRQYRESRSI